MDRASIAFASRGEEQRLLSSSRRKKKKKRKKKSSWDSVASKPITPVIFFFYPSLARFWRIEGKSRRRIEVERVAQLCGVWKADPGKGGRRNAGGGNRWDVGAVNRMEGCIIRRCDCLWIYSAVATAAAAEAARYPEAALAR